MKSPPLTIEKRFAYIRDYIDRMPSLSTTVTKVLEVCNHPNASPNDLNRVISLDPVLTGQVLKLINSAYYSLPNQITSLTRAIIMLGLNTVKNLALSTAVLGTIGKEESFQCLPMDPFWTHSICVGVTAKTMAIHKGVEPAFREEFFVAGLLHDLGKIPLNNCFTHEYQQSLDLAKLEQGALYRSESMMMGITHGEVGNLIAEKWQLTGALAEVLCYHHAPEKAIKKNRGLIAIVAAANMYANMYEIGSAGDAYVEPSDVASILKMIGMNWSDLGNFHETVQNEIDKAQIFLKVAEGAARG